MKHKRWILKKYLLAGILLISTAIFVQPGKAQISNQTQGFQSPEASSLGKFGDMPVSFYTGTPSTNIPLYVVQSGDLEVPISLDYHASGIKVDEIASWVGLGWALNAGGVITRTVRGLPDEKPTEGYLATYDLLYEEENWPLASGQPYNGNCLESDLLCKVQNGAVDTEPDMYFYNFGGRSGKFFRGPQKVATIPYENIKITPDGWLEWTIVTENGTKYIFGSPDGSGEIEKTNEFTLAYKNGNKAGGRSSNRKYTSAWYLREIHDANGNNVIRFNYDLVTTQSALKQKVAEQELLNGCFISGGSFNAGKVNTDQELRIIKPVLQKIETNKETVSFISSGNRNDQPFGTTGLRKLEAIKVLSKTGEIKKHVQLAYGYFNRNDEEAKRLRLESVTELSDTGTAGATHNFDYIDSEDDLSLPRYGSFAKDFWGYYNGANANTTALPALPKLNETGANRRPDSEAVQAGLLERITYPTGGFTQITYEAHDYSRVGKDWIPENELREVIVTRNEEANFYPIAVDLHATGVETISAGDWLEKEFTITGSESVEVEFDIHWPTRRSEGNDEVIIPSYVYVNIAEAQTDQFITGYNLQLKSGGQGHRVNTSHKKNLDPGTYKFKMSGVSVCSSGCYFSWDDLYDLKFSVLAKWAETKVDTTISLLAKVAGGVRVKSIRTSDGTNSGRGQIRNFTYRLDSEPERSSGVILAEPVQHYEFDTPGCTFKQRSSSSYIPLGSLGGRNIGYSEVHVTYGDNQEGGKKTFYYSNAGDAPDINYPQSAGPAFFRAQTSNEWRRGQLVKSQIYSKKGNLLQQANKKYYYNKEGLSLIDGLFYPNDFNINESSLHPLASVLRATSISFPVTYTTKDQQGNNVTITYAVQNPYYLVSGWYHPEKETIRTYDPQTGIDSKIETEYIYEHNISSPAIGQLREVEKTNSDGTKRITGYKYAHEVTDDGTGISYTSMRDLNMLTQPYSLTVKDGTGTVLRKNWMLWDNSDGWWRPRSKWQWLEGNSNSPVFDSNN